MLITFLGTAAANAFPEAFCKCRNCAQARLLRGPSLRKRSSALINDDLLIDLGPDIMVASQVHGRSLDDVQYCLQTHPHADHLDLSHLLLQIARASVVVRGVLAQPTRTAVYGPVRTVVWQESAGDRRPYADQTTLSRLMTSILSSVVCTVSDRLQ